VTRKTIVQFALIILAVMFSILPVYAQQLPVSDSRPLIKYEKPVTPEIAHKMQLKGTVKLEATVSSSGRVTGVRSLGGHPLLVQASTLAVKDWVFEPNGKTSTTLVTLEFK
jgi:TonB family protein